MLIGRATERQRLRALLDSARSGVSGTLALIGEPGIGKTALLEDAVASASDFLVLRARGNEADAELPFAGLADILRPIVKLSDDIPPPQSAALAGALGTGPQVPADPFTTYVATFSLLSRAAEERPVLVVADDFHWLDQSSQDALIFVARRLGAESLVMLFAVRAVSTEPTLPHDLPQLVLGGLPADMALILLRDGADAPVTASVARRICADTGGNPLALGELARLLAPGQLNGIEDLPDPLPMGGDLRKLFLRRIAALPDESRHAMVIVSASGNGDPTAIDTALDRVGRTLDDLEPAERAGILTMDASIQFTHPLVRAALYHEASPAERRRAHAALAEVMAGTDDQVRRAWHLASATVGTDESVAAAVEAAGDQARARGAHAVAATAFRRAAELSAMPPSRVPRLLAAATEHVLGGQAAKALPLLEDARERVPDPAMRAEIDHFRGRVLMNVGPLSEAQEVLSIGAGAIEGTDPDRAASMLSDAALISFISGHVEQGEGFGRRAMSLTGWRDDRPGEINHILFTGMLVLRGKASEAAEHVERERRRILALQASDEWQLIALSAIWLMWAEEYELARTVLDGAVDQARRLGAVGLLPLSLAQRAELSWRLGEGSAAYALAGEAVKLATDTGQAVTVAYANAVQALVLAGQGRDSECRASAEAALNAAEPVGGGSTVTRVEAALGLLELGAGRYAEAVRHLMNAHGLLQSQGVGEPTVIPYAGDLIEALLRSGRVAEAEDAIAELEGAAGGPARTWTRAVVARSRGMLAGEGDFQAHFDDALRLHDLLPGRFDRARTLLAAGERLRRSGQRLKAREPLRDALHAFDRVGAAAWAGRARAELRAAGDPASEASMTELATLTPQELQIALAVANGLTNREVAAALFLSPKTIEFHLGNVYSKLALRSRSQLVRFIAAQA